MLVTPISWSADFTQREVCRHRWMARKQLRFVGRIQDFRPLRAGFYATWGLSESVDDVESGLSNVPSQLVCQVLCRVSPSGSVDPFTMLTCVVPPAHCTEYGPPALQIGGFESGSGGRFPLASTHPAGSTKVLQKAPPTPAGRTPSPAETTPAPPTSSQSGSPGSSGGRSAGTSNIGSRQVSQLTETNTALTPNSTPGIEAPISLANDMPSKLRQS